MEAKSKRQYEAKAQIMKALSHPTRLFIVDQLADQEQCVNDLTDMVGHDISTVSKHLSVLKNAGIVAAEKRGAQVFYSLRIPCVMGFFRCVDEVIRSNARESAIAATQ